MSTTNSLRSALQAVVAGLANEAARLDGRPIPTFRFDGEEIKSAQDVAAALGISVIEAKARIRHVRTAEGVSKYRQPIGSIITEDVLPSSLPKLKKHSWKADPEPSRKRWTTGDAPSANGPIGGRKSDHFGSIVQLGPGDYRLRHHNHKTGEDRSSYHQSFKDAKDHFDKEVFKTETLSRRVKPKSKKRYVLQEDWGTYGRDWTYGRDADPTELHMPEWDEDVNVRIQWAEKQIRDLGMKIEGDPLNPDFTEVAAKFFASQEEQYPGLMSLITHYGSMTDYPNAYAYNKVKFDPSDYGKRPTNGIYYNKGFFGKGFNNDNGASAIRRDGQEGTKWFSARYSAIKEKFPEYSDAQLSSLKTTAHETGHTVARIVFSQFDGAEDRMKSDEERNYYRQMFWYEASTVMENFGLGDAESIYDKMADVHASPSITAHEQIPLSKQATKDILSVYGGTNYHEMLAEVWSEYQLDPEPRPFAAEMGALMEQVLEEYLYWETTEVA